MKNLKLIFKCLAASAILASAQYTVSAQTVSDYSILPETIGVAPDQTPNILFIFDSSGSMRWDKDGDYVGAHDENSRSFAMRKVLRELFTENVGQYNVGLMTFGGTASGPAFTGPFQVDTCNDYTGCGTGIGLWTRNLTGRGTLLSNLSALDSTKVTELNGILATEPHLPTLTNTNYFAPGFNFGYYSAANTMYQNNILVSQGSTPLTGSLDSAYRYLVTQSIPSDEQDIVGGGSVSYPGFTPSVTAACRPDTFVFLVTDGLPTMDKDGNSADIDDEVPNVAASAATLRAQGIDTYVFGFQLPADAKANMDTISQSGSGRNAFISDSSDQLKAQINAALEEVRVVGGSSSGISVVASSSDTAGSVVQAIYNPEIKGTETVTNPDGTTGTQEVVVSWTSTLSAYFLDEFGYLREDSTTGGTRGKLDDYTIDRAFVLRLEDVDSDGDGAIDTQDVRATRIRPENFGSASFQEVETEADVLLSELEPIWEASEVLGQPYAGAATDADRAAVATTFGTRNRSYNQLASGVNGYRRIYTWIQSNPSNDAFETGNLIDFVFDPADDPADDTLNKTNYTLLDAGSIENADKVVRFIRGEEDIVGLRDRTLNDRSYLLGDIVHSTAAQVDSPSGNFNTRFQDDSYSAFKDEYEFRRRMVYVGSNGGLLHAFNGGFWDGEQAQLNLKAPDGSDDLEHALGAEIWAYAPMNLLPHLKFLADPSYDSTLHVSYVDGPIQSFDVRAFNEDSTHINGWGTIIVAGMRFGGGDYPNVDHDADGDAADEFTTRSAYIVLDVTDPREEPVVIGEITHEDLGFTTSVPTVMKEGDDWFLVFGSGPNDITTATSVGPDATTARQPRIYKYRLNEGSRGFESDADGNDLIGSVSGFVGDLIAHDWNSDYNDDAVYFGVVTGTADAPTGAMYRYVSSGASDSGSSETNLLLNTGQPMINRALLKRSSGKNWVFVGSGRYLTSDDAFNTNQNSFYGIQEQDDFSTVAKSSLVNVTNVSVDENGDLSPAVAGQDTFSSLRNFILSDENTDGWFYNVPTPSAAPSNKISAPALSFRDFLFYTDFAPPAEDDNLCTNEFGESFLNVVDLVTGTASFTADFDGPLGTDADGDIIRRTSIGEGYANQSYLFVGPDPETGKSRVIIKSPLSTGEIADTPIALPPQPNGRTSWREIEVQ